MSRRYLDAKRQALADINRPPQRKECKLATCERLVYSMGLCRRHWQALDVLPPIKSRRDTPAHADEMAARFEQSLEQQRQEAQRGQV